MRVFSGTLATETNTFGPMPTGLASFKDRAYYPAGQHPDRLTMFSGPLWAARIRGKELGWELHEGLVAASQPNGITTREAYESLRDELLSDLKSAMPVDMVLLGLHGAMVADGYDDCEGDLLMRVREIVGPEVVIGAELDPHNHLTPEMVQAANLLIAFKEYPHTDILERGLELVDLCAATVAGHIKPVASVVDCNMIVLMHTTREPARSFVDKISSLESQDGILSISVTHGFPWGDVPAMGTKMLVYSDGDAQKAHACASKLADELVGLREALNTTYPDIPTAFEQALGMDGVVILADGADNPGGGAAGDSTFILEEIFRRNIKNVAIGPIWDPVSVRIAFEAGEGATIQLRVGGKIGPLSGQPMDVKCQVKALKRDMVMTALANSTMAMGDSVLIDVDGVEMVLVTIRAQAVNTDMFSQLGCELESKRLIVVKSSQHFYESFTKVTPNVIYVGAPGAVSQDYKTLPFQKIQRPKWPIDID